MSLNKSFHINSCIQKIPGQIMCLIFNMGNGIAITCFWERWGVGRVGGRCTVFP